MQQQDASSSSAVSFCPSFNTYSSDVATRVSREFKAEESSISNDLLEQLGEDDQNDDFQFVSIVKNIEATQLFFDGQIRQVFPVFNRDLLLNDGDYDRGNEQTHEAIREFPLENLFIDDDQDGPPSSSSSDADEPKEVNNVTFCVWSPRRSPIESSPSRCKKSNSTGSSSASSSSSSSSLKRWLKFRDLLKRSNSDGKDSFVFLSKPKNNVDSKEKKILGEVKPGKAVSPVSAHAAFYVKNRAIKEGDKKRSYLPYRQDLVGLFASSYHGLGKTFPSF